ncbi:MAG: hypothetical protein ACRDRK_17815 [Pseudonocardia sp.]
MAVPEEIRTRLSRWCTASIPHSERAHRQIGYTIHGDDVTIVDRRPPIYPEQDVAWTSTPLAQLRRSDPEQGLWSLYRPGPDGPGSWQREGQAADDPFVLLDSVTH